jgi:hypothetical protein
VGDKNIGTMKLLDTPSGNIAKELVHQSIPLSIGVRAFGKIDKDGVVHEDNFKFISYDVINV